MAITTKNTLQVDEIKIKSNPFLERAEPLLARGFSIIPCEPRGKKPLHSPADPTRDPAIVAAWAERWPDANVGVVADENFCILDV